MLYVFVVVFTVLYFTNGIQSQSLEVDEDVVLILHTRNNDPFELNDTNIKTVDTSKPTKVIVHGWRSKPNASWVMNMTQAYLNRSDYNIITVGWTYFSSSKNYLSSYSKVPLVADLVTHCLLTLSGSSEKFLDRVHLIGHSLGAHVSGMVGQRVFSQAFYKVARITGLDPAGPGFELPLKRSINHRLSKDDAQFVDVIHTNGGILGFKGILGDVDFYPNGGGPRQPGCGIIDEQCSHRRAHQYFTESILSAGFIGRDCFSWKKFLKGMCNNRPEAVMGEDVPPTTLGKYYLRTRSESPFAAGP